MGYFEQIKDKIIDNEVYQRVKEYSKESFRLNTYFEIGSILSEVKSKYGDKLIDEYSKKLVTEFGSEYSRSNLYRMKQLYNVLSNSNVATLWRQLTWSHCKLILPINDLNEVSYYISEAVRRNLSVRKLKLIIDGKEYERQKSSLNNLKSIDVKDEFRMNIRNPIILRSDINYKSISEKILHNIIMENIPVFLKELGVGFSFIDDEYAIKIGGKYSYIDFLLYNYRYKCYVVVELKTNELKKEYIGQIKYYMNYIDKCEKSELDHDTIGIIISRKNDRFIVEYSSNENIVPIEYKII